MSSVAPQFVLAAQHHVSAPQLALVTGGTSDVWSSDFGRVQLALLKQYAQRHKYMLFVERNLTRFSPTHHPAWNKILLLRDLLRAYAPSALPILLWIDVDVIISDMRVGVLDLLLGLRHCDVGLGQKRWAPYLARSDGGARQEGAVRSSSTSLWFGRDSNEYFLINVNTGLMGLRNDAVAREFLEAVWATHRIDPEGFKRHDPFWARKRPTSPYYGWPWEQGGVWDVLAAEPHRFLAASCVAHPSVLQYLVSNGMPSKRTHAWVGGQPWGFRGHLKRGTTPADWNGTLCRAKPHCEVRPRAWGWHFPGTPEDVRTHAGCVAAEHNGLAEECNCTERLARRARAVEECSRSWC